MQSTSEKNSAGKAADVAARQSFGSASVGDLTATSTLVH